MKKIFTLFAIFACLPILLSAKGPAVIGGSTYTADTLSHYKVGPGTYYTAIHFYGPKDMRAFYLEIDATNPYLSFQSVLGRDSLVTCEGITNMAARKSKEGSRYFAGTNADFFATSGAIGTPVHGCAVEGQLAKVPVSSGPQTSFTTNDECFISFVTYAGELTHNETTYTIHNVNGSRSTDQLVLYNRYVGNYTHTNAYGYEIPVSLADGEKWGLNKTVKLKVAGTGSAAGNMAIAENGAVLSGHGTSADFLQTLQPGDELEIKIMLQLEDGSYPDINCMVGGDRKILENGEVLETDWAELHPRTAIGYSADRSKVYMLVVDGRQGGYSDGATTKQMADMMKFAGAANAMNLDGGGSSGMYIEKYGQVNSPSDGHERAVSNGIFVVSNAPDDNTDTLSVTVQIPDRRNRAIDDFSDASSWDITNSALKDISIVPTAQGTELRYTFSSGRAPYLQIAKDIYLYSLPDSMRITLNTGATQVSKIALSMKNNASSTSTLTEFENIPQNTDHVISIPMNGYFENYRDMSLYPVKFQSLKLFILGSSQTAGNQYTIALKEFSLIYDGITVNVSNPEIASLLRVYPNPVEAGASQIHFVLPQNADVNCELYNLGGQLLNRVEMGQTPAGEITLPIGNLASGTYLLKIYRNGIADSVKIIVK